METRRFKIGAPLACLLLLIVAAQCQTTSAASGLTWDKQPDSLALRKDGQIVWRFNFGSDERKPNFHPLALAGGPVLSCYRPSDHLWHRGLWFSWKYINKVNYWEEDRRTGLPAGKTEWGAPELDTRPDFSARLVLDLKYHPTNGPVVLTEHRVITTSPPDPTGAYRLDWEMTFHTVGAEVLLDRAEPVDKNGVNTSGGYAGLGIRGATNLTDAEVVTTDGPVKYENHRFRAKAPALDFSGTADGRTAGVAFLDHSANMNSPTPWYVVNSPDNKVPMYYISPAVITYAPKLLKEGDTFTLRYRVVVHPDRWTSAQLQEASKSYQSGN